jgi:xylulokinase
MKAQIIAIDVGTTGAKTALLTRAGEILVSHTATYETVCHEMQVEQRPNDWWNAVQAGIGAVRPRIELSQLSGLVLGGQMQDLILLDNEGVLGPAILYADTRAQAEMQEIERRIGPARLKDITGNVPDASSLLAKLLWLKNYQPEVYTATTGILCGAHDYIAWKLTGSRCTDFTTAATTGLLNIRQNRWADDVLTELGLRTDFLPHLVPAAHQDGYLASEAAAALGLPAACPVFHGSGDVGTTTLGANAGEPGTTSCYLGTSGWVASTTENVLGDPETGIFNLRHPDPERIIQVGPMLLAAGNVQWAVEQIGDFADADQAYTQFNKLAAEARPGAGGVLYLPYLVGERSPFKAPAARGGFLGLSRTTTRADLARAVLEGVALAMRTIQEAISGPALGLQSLTLTGGGAKSAVWPQIFADVFHCEVLVLEQAAEVGVIGAALLCGNTLGWYTGYQLPASLLRLKQRYVPQADNRALYDDLYAIFRQTAPALRSSWTALQQYRHNRC